MMSHAIRELSREPEMPSPPRWVTIETHFDAAAVPPDMADRLVSLGFELDGFHVFVPGHFTDHFTLKYKLDRGAVQRRRQLKVEMDERSAILKMELTRDWPEIEGYMESEVYTERDRRKWDSRALDRRWNTHWPFGNDKFISTDPPQDEQEAAEKGLPLDLVKICDIHAKLDRNLEEIARSDLIGALSRLGFYNVRTWSGNDVCTCQFAEASEGRATFEKLTNFFDAVGGCSEATLEYVPSVWRSSCSSAKGSRLAKLPPLIIEIQVRRVEGEHEGASERVGRE